jgi:hypothetical protein
MNYLWLLYISFYIVIISYYIVFLFYLLNLISRVCCSIFQNQTKFMGITILYLKSWRCELWIWRSHFGTSSGFGRLNSTHAILGSVNRTGKLCKLTPPTLQIQYCYSLIHSRKYLSQPYCLQTSAFGVGI